MCVTSEYPPEPTHSYDQEQEQVEDYYGGPTRVTMVTEESYPYATTAEAHYAKEDQETMEVEEGAGHLFHFYIMNFLRLAQHFLHH